jgi:GntR family transcriptional regulator, transcriptional repressor for pyruvate dehydrogenase complex
MLPEAAGARPTLAGRVAEQLKRLIDRGEFPRDCRLPTEFALCRRFGVSRPVVRAALAMLREAGLVASLKGSGSVVLAGPEAGGQKFPLIRTVADIAQFFEFRIALEREAARLAALRHTREDLAGIEAALAEADEVLEGGHGELSGDVNFRFHRAVALATGNAFHVATMEAMPNLIGLGPIEVRHAGLAEPQARRALIQHDHRRIFEAIAARDAVRAAAEMEAHIAASQAWVFQRHPSRLALAGG